MNFPVAKLGDLCDMHRQGLDPDDAAAAGLRFVGVETAESQNGVLNFTKGARVGSPRSTTFRFDERYILYAKLRPYLNKVTTPDFAGKCSTELAPLLPRDDVDREFVAHPLRRKQTVEHVRASLTGSRMSRTDMKALILLPVPFPPLDERRRIVDIPNRAARIERLRTQASHELAPRAGSVSPPNGAWACCTQDRDSRQRHRTGHCPACCRSSGSVRAGNWPCGERRKTDIVT